MAEELRLFGAEIRHQITGFGEELSKWENLDKYDYYHYMLLARGIKLHRRQLQ